MLPSKKRKFSSPYFEDAASLKECLICGAKEKTKTTKLNRISRQSAPQLYHLECQRCHHALLALVDQDHLGSTSIGLFTDLSATDALRLGLAEEGVDTEAVMEVRRLLQKNLFFDRIKLK